MIRILLIGLYSLLFLMPQGAYLYCQHTGFKYFKNYTPDDYNLQPQNWAVVQDKRGFIYVGNVEGLAEYDSVSWRKIEVPNMVVRSLAVDKKGIIYVGGINEIGYLAPSPNGSLQYVSLLEYINEKQRNFGSVWKTHSLGNLVYFRTSKYLFRWNPTERKMQVWEPKEIFASSFVCREEFFIFQKNVGLMQFIKDSLKLVPNGKAFAGKWITMMAPYGDRRMLVGTFSNGFYLYDGKTFVPFITAADEYMIKNQLYHGTGLTYSPNHFALATKRGGLVIINTKGQVKNIFNKACGLQDDNVKYVFEDSQGNLWLALNNGISRIEYASPISFFDNRHDLPGLVLSVVRHGPNLYAGTTSGLYSLGPDGKFRLITGITGMCWDLLAVGHSILAASSDGIFQVQNNAKRMVLDAPSYVLHRSRKDSNRVWVGTRWGLTSVYSDLSNGSQQHRWNHEKDFDTISQEIRTIIEDPDGSLWLGTFTRGVLKVDFSGSMNQPMVRCYNTAHGLPQGEVNVFKGAGHVMFATSKGVFRFDEKNNVFIPDYTLGNQFAGGVGDVFRIAEDKNKNIWFHSRSKNFQAIYQSNGSYTINHVPFLRIPDAQVNFIYPDPPGDATWFASHKGLFRYDTGIKKDYHQPFHTYIRRVWVDKKPAFEGYKKETETGGLSPVIEHENRNLRVEFAAPFFEAEAKTRYQYLLEGYDKDRSEWTSETKKDYTNLDAGMYTFRVRAKNVYEHISEEYIFQFRVLPPWYQTGWAYLIYTLISFMGIYLIVKWRSWKLVQEKRRLEQTVKERTKEVYEKNILLEEQSEKLKEMDRVKSRFFANISHEFRTPLTLIMGPLEQRLPGCQDKEQKEEMQMMLRNSQRLLTLINQLLDLSKLDSGKMVLHAALQNVVPFLKGLLGSFESLAVQKKLELKFYAREEDIFLYYDTEKLEKVFSNLLSNACKFTPAGGQISINVKRIPQDQSQAYDERFPGGYLEISVRDTGIGIARDQLAQIFDRFYQAEKSPGHQYEGTGIGLSLVKELVELHHGTINAHSQEGEGTEFMIRLPLGESHLKPEEIVEPYNAAGIGENHMPAGEMAAIWEVKTEHEEVPGEGKEPTKESIKIETEIEEKPVILVVEDNADVRRYIRGPLNQLYCVVEAADGREGIEKAKETIPDLIISDVMMPQMDGFELCKVLKQDVKTSHIPIILLTAKASEASVIEGLETGADDYITKPFNIKIMLTRIKNLIDLRRQLQEKIQREMVLRPTEIAVSSVDQEFMKELKEVIEKNLSGEEFGVDELAGALYMGRATLNRKIRALTGESTNQFIQSYRLKRAAQLLKANFGNVTEVSFEVGFSSSAYFTKCFKEKFHQLPHDYKD